MTWYLNLINYWVFATFVLHLFPVRCCSEPTLILNSPSLGLGVGGNSPGMCAVSVSCPPFPPFASGLATVFGRTPSAKGLVCDCLGEEKVSPKGGRGRGLERPERFGEEETAFKRSSVARNLASRASSSEVWEETAFFLRDGKFKEFTCDSSARTYFWSTAASRSAKLPSILKRSFKASENDRAIVLERVRHAREWYFFRGASSYDWGRGEVLLCRSCQALSISSSDSARWKELDMVKKMGKWGNG
jgi:hypothetical protein